MYGDLTREEDGSRAVDIALGLRDVGEMWARCGRDVGEMWARCGGDVGDILGETRGRYSGDIVQLGLAERLPISPLYLPISPPYLLISPHISLYLPISPLYSASVLPITWRSASLYLHHISASPGEAPQPRPPQRSPGRTAPGIESVTVVLSTVVSIAVRISLRSEAQAARAWDAEYSSERTLVSAIVSRIARGDMREISGRNGGDGGACILGGRCSGSSKRLELPEEEPGSG